jgi:hypothetical protein
VAPTQAQEPPTAMVAAAKAVDASKWSPERARLLERF